MSHIAQLEKEKRRAYNKNNLKEVANICNLLGTEFQECGKYDLALQEHKEESILFQGLNDAIGVAIAHRRMGEVYSDMGKWNKALEHQERYLSLAIECEDLVEQQRAYATIGRTHMQRSEVALMEEKREQQFAALKESQKAFLKSLSACDKISDKVDSKELCQMRCRIYHNIGLVLDFKGETVDAISFVSQALELCDKYDLLEDMYRSYSELARMHLKLDQISKAFEEAEMSLKVSLKLQNKRNIIDAHFLIAQVHLSNDEFLAAKKCLYKAFKIKHHSKPTDIIEKHLKLVVSVCLYRDEICKPETSDESRLKYLDKIGDACTHLGLFKQAIVFYKKRLELALEKNRDHSFLAPIYTSLAQTYKDNKQFDKALEYFQKELDIHLTTNLKEAVVTLIEMAKVTETSSPKSNEGANYLEQAIEISAKTNTPKLKGFVITHYLTLPNLPSDKKEDLQRDLREIQEIHGSDFEFEESEVESEDEEIDLDHIEFSDSDEELLKANTRAWKSTRSASIKVKKNATGETALHQAAIKGNVSMVKRLIEQSHPVNERDNSGWLPIHEACNWGNVEVVELLVDAGAWINDRGGKECSGTTPLHDAASNGHLDVVKMLVEKGATVLTKDTNGDTPLNCLVRHFAQDHFNDDELDEYHIIHKFLSGRMERAGYRVPGNLKAKQTGNKSSRPRGDVERRSSKEESLLDPFGDDLTMDFGLDFDGTFQSPSNRSSVPTAGGSSATDSYKNAIKNVGSSFKNVDTSPHQTVSKDANKAPLIPEEDYVNDDWLIDDCETKKRKRSDNFEFEFKEKNRRRSSPESLPKVTRKKRQSKLPFVSKKRPAFAADHFDDDGQHRSSEDEIEEVSSFHPQGSGFSSQSSRLGSTMSQSSPLRLQVKIFNEKHLVPVAATAQSHTISWLREEISRRYFQITGVKLTFKLSTINDEILNPDDAISSIFSLDNCELVASVMGIRDLPPLSDRYAQMCQRLKLVPFPEVTSVLKNGESSSHLDFSHTFLKDEKDLQPIFTAIQHQNIQVLNFSSCCIEDSGMDTLLLSFSSLSLLESLEMEACSLSTESFNALAQFVTKEAPSVKKLSSINLSYNDFNDTTFSHLKAILSLPSLSELKLRSCGIVLTSTDPLDHFTSNLSSLNLNENEICLSAFSAIVSSCPRLTSLSIEDSISPRGNGLSKPSLGTSLSALLGRGSECFLETLDLSGCHVTNDDVDTLVTYLYRCGSIRTLNLGRNERLASPSVTSLVREIGLSTNVPLTTLALHGVTDLARDPAFAASLSRVIEDKASSPHPFLSLSIPHSNTNETVKQLWQKVNKDKAITSTVSNAIFFKLKLIT